MRFWFFLLRLAVLTGVVFWLASAPGTARIVWHDQLIETSAAFLAFALVGGAFLLYALYRLWRFVMDGPRLWRLHRKLRKMQQGQVFLTQGLAAIAGGNAAEAGRLALAARKALGPTISTRLLQAQAAQLAGDHAVASEIFRALASAPESAVLGYRGLIMEALRAENWDEVDSLIDRLRRAKPDVPWLGLIQFDLAVRRRRWADASAALAKLSASRLIDPKEAAAREAALLLAQAEIEARHTLTDRALQTAERAARKAPSWTPALLALAERQIAVEHFRAAQRTIERGWGLAPHPAFARLYAKAARSAKPIEAYKQIEKLTRSTREHPVALFVLGEAALAADLWGEARRHLTSLVKTGLATQGCFSLLADLERRETKNERAVMGWLARLPAARPDPRWLCRECGGAQEKWQVQCPCCGAFNPFLWQSPGESRGEKPLALSHASFET
jgi:HemY protein